MKLVMKVIVENTETGERVAEYGFDAVKSVMLADGTVKEFTRASNLVNDPKEITLPETTPDISDAPEHDLDAFEHELDLLEE